MTTPETNLVTTEFLLGLLVRIWMRGHFNRSEDDSKVTASLKSLPDTGDNLQKLCPKALCSACRQLDRTETLLSATEGDQSPALEVTHIYNPREGVLLNHASFSFPRHASLSVMGTPALPPGGSIEFGGNYHTTVPPLQSGI